MSAPRRIGIVGAGAWGSALALLAARAGREVVLWARDPATARLPGVMFPASVTRTGDPNELATSDVVLLVVPAQAMPAAMPAFAGIVGPATPLVLCSKGIERETGRFLSEIVADILPGRPIGALSGPGFAADVREGKPIAVTIAMPDLAEAEALSAALASPLFRPYASDDVRGVEIGGASKNVYAIAAGVVVGLGLGESARAALIARAHAEMVRFGRAFGARSETFAGLSGLGDLVLTATSTQSRNHRFGVALGQGTPAAEALAAIGTVEGAPTAVALSEVARRAGVDMPVAEAVGALVAGRASVEAVVEGLMARPLRTESAILASPKPATR